MKGKLILIFFSIIIISLGIYGDAICSDNQPRLEKTIVFATIFPKSVSFFNEMSLIYTEAFKRLGYNFKLTNIPGERAMVDANSGALDGEAGRIAYLNSNQYPNLIRVGESILVMKDGAYSADTSITINGWESLRGKGFKVGLIKGTKSIEQKLPQYVEKENIITLKDIEQCLKMLQARRIDIFITATLLEDSAPMKSGAYEEIKRVGIVEEKILYPWFNKRHKELVSQLADTLKAMKAEGTFQKLIEDAKQK
jgi:ABC-type amino acid transport substrate-binding protein